MNITITTVYTNKNKAGNIKNKLYSKECLMITMYFEYFESEVQKKSANFSN